MTNVITAAEAVLVKLGAIPSAISTTADVIGELPKIIGAVSNFNAFIHTAAAALKDSTLTVEDKIDALLNDVEVFVNQEFPNASASFSEVAQEVEALVKEVLSLFDKTKTLAAAI